MLPPGRRQQHKDCATGGGQNANLFGCIKLRKIHQKVRVFGQLQWFFDVILKYMNGILTHLLTFVESGVTEICKESILLVINWIYFKGIMMKINVLCSFFGQITLNVLTLNIFSKNEIELMWIIWLCMYCNIYYLIELLLISCAFR